MQRSRHTVCNTVGNTVGNPPLLKRRRQLYKAPPSQLSRISGFPSRTQCLLMCYACPKSRQRRRLSSLRHRRFQYLFLDRRPFPPLEYTCSVVVPFPCLRRRSWPQASIDSTKVVAPSAVNKPPTIDGKCPRCCFCIMSAPSANPNTWSDISVEDEGVGGVQIR